MGHTQIITRRLHVFRPSCIADQFISFKITLSESNSWMPQHKNETKINKNKHLTLIDFK